MDDPLRPSEADEPNVWEAPRAPVGAWPPAQTGWLAPLALGYLGALVGATALALARPLETGPLVLLAVVVLVFFVASVAILIGTYALFLVKIAKAVASVIFRTGRGGRPPSPDARDAQD